MKYDYPPTLKLRMGKQKNMKKYDHNKIEKKWQKYWQTKKINEVDLSKAKKPFYNLMMFPYPSAEGLHVGNMYAFVHSDTYGRFLRLRGLDVFEPIGLDGFGIHSENYAIKVKQNILNVSKRTEKHFYEQLHMIGNQYDWSRTVETYKPEYYKWTQWIFVQMFKKGLAYQAESYVNWCPSCQTVLSDEQVVSGECERCGSQAERKLMRQWFFKITAYAERLLKNLTSLSADALGPNVKITEEMAKAGIDWSERTKIAQRDWIGKSEGTQFCMRIITSDPSVILNKVKNLSRMRDKNFGQTERSFANAQDDKLYLSVFTTRLDTVFGMTFALIAPEHELINKLKGQISNIKELEEYIAETKKKSELQRMAEVKEKTGVELKGIKVVNPFTKKAIPLFASDFVLAHYGTGAVMAVPAHDERDYEFAKKFNLSIVEVVKSEDGESSIAKEAFVEDGILINSESYNALGSGQAREKMTKWLEEQGIGSKKINYKLRDWCISRQRYWGPPIPMIYCDKKDGWQPVPEKDLPVLLPKTKDYLPKNDGLAPLARNKKFVKTKCPVCNGPARRETDVSDTFLDSAWYYFRYPSVGLASSGQALFDPAITRKWLPVDMYIGGNEHAVLHLLYSRFVTMAFHDLGLIDFEEPYKRFFAHGLLIKEGAKMSKSKGNVINPDEYIKKFGADSVRLYLMFLGDVRQGGDWRDSGMNGMFRFVNRVWNIAQEIIKQKSKKTDLEILKFAHKTIKRVGEDLEKLKFNTAIAALMEYVNALYDGQNAGKNIDGDTISILAKLISPFAPFLAEELWSSFTKASKDKSQKYSGSIFEQPWPEYDPALIKEETLELIVQINGKVRAKLSASADISEEEAKKLALADESVKKWLGSKEPKKVFFVKGRLINIVINEK